MNKRKGFTLIELLAVIVILAIIALIATPIVMNVIENSKKGAAERSAENYIDAVETAVLTYKTDGKILEGRYIIQSVGNLCLSGYTCTEESEIKIDMSGTKPTAGILVIENGLVTKDSILKIGDYIVSYDDSKKSYVAGKSETKSTTDGILTLDGNTTLYNYRIYGNSVQDGTPISDNPVEIQSVGDKTVNLFNFDKVKGQVSGTADYDNKSIFLSKSENLCIIGQSFTGVPTAFNKFNEVLNITTAGYYCLKVKITSDVENIIPRSSWVMNVTSDNNNAIAPKFVDELYKDGYYFIKYNVTQEMLDSLKNYANTFRLYMYQFKQNDTFENVDVTISEIMFAKGDYTFETMPSYELYGKYKIPIKVNDVIKNIYLDESLRKIGDYADYIDFEKGKVVRNVELLDDTGTLTKEESLKALATPIEEIIELPNIPTLKGTTILSVDTNIKPSNFEVEYKNN